jgi:hypothetical protein
LAVCACTSTSTRFHSAATNWQQAKTSGGAKNRERHTIHTCLSRDQEFSFLSKIEAIISSPVVVLLFSQLPGPPNQCVARWEGKDRGSLQRPPSPATPARYPIRAVGRAGAVVVVVPSCAPPRDEIIRRGRCIRFRLVRLDGTVARRNRIDWHAGSDPLFSEEFSLHRDAFSAPDHHRQKSDD